MTNISPCSLARRPTTPDPSSTDFLPLATIAMSYLPPTSPHLSSTLLRYIQYPLSFTLPLSCVAWSSVVLCCVVLCCGFEPLLSSGSSVGRTLSLSADCSGFQYSRKAFYNWLLLTYVQTYLGSGGMQGGGMQGGGMQGGGSQLSSTNLYIRGLSEKCCDEDLTRMCQQ